MELKFKVVAPKTLLPHSIERLGVKAFTDMKKGLEKFRYRHDVKITKRKNAWIIPTPQQENIMNILV
ncbi:MAG: hypothetical protein Ct9H300mP5_5580 [Candidatus Pelagibacterales bacterium]|nr:MAG: hypothetical protein Ct9H300mP5_5580 [Pelagibacterales bacterium]